jgi:hypothetical protein
VGRRERSERIHGRMIGTTAPADDKLA